MVQLNSETLCTIVCKVNGKQKCSIDRYVGRFKIKKALSIAICNQAALHSILYRVTSM